MMAIYSEVRWQPEDIMEAAKKRGKEMSYLEAKEWLLDNDDELTYRLIEAGWEIIDDML